MTTTVIKFIGGLLDGRRKEITEMDRARGYILLRVPERPAQATIDCATPEDLAKLGAKIRDVCYRRFAICDVEVWASEHLRPPQIIELLLERYAKR